MDNIKIAIISDIHSNLEALSAVLDFASGLGITHYVCLGDIVGYNASPSECIDAVKALHPIACIIGNHDEYAGADHPLFGFNPLAAYAVSWTREQLNSKDREWLLSLQYDALVSLPGMESFRIVHGSLDNPQLWGYVSNRLQAMASMEYQKPCRLCFCGHTHRPMFFEKDEEDTKGYYMPDGEPLILRQNCSYLVNVGSIGQPRDGNPNAAFAVYEPARAAVQLYRVPYDVEACQKRVLDAGLPEYLAERLAQGV